MGPFLSTWTGWRWSRISMSPPPSVSVPEEQLASSSLLHGEFVGAGPSAELNGMQTAGMASRKAPVGNSDPHGLAASGLCLQKPPLGSSPTSGTPIDAGNCLQPPAVALGSSVVSTIGAYDFEAPGY